MILEKQFHDAWHVSCGVNSPNSLATILGTVNLNANLSHNVFHLHEQTYQYLSQIHIPIPKIPPVLETRKFTSFSSRPHAFPPKTPSRPPPTCPVCTRDWPSCSRRRACPGVVVPVGTRFLPMLGGKDLLPGGSRWSAKVVKHEKSSRSRGFMADLWERVKVNEGHTFWTLMRKYYSKHLSKTVGTHRNKL